MHFGAALRVLRVDAGVSLSELARIVGVSPAYLSRVEHGHDPVPTPDRIAAIARALDVPPMVLLEVAQGAGAALASYLERVPEAATLFLEMARRDFGAIEIARVSELMERHIPDRSAASRRARLGELLAVDRILLRVVCDDLEDLVAVAAARLGRTNAEASAIAAAILHRESDAPSLIGGGVAVPHAIVRGVPAAAAVVSLARPMRVMTPDGEPVRAGIVIVSPSGGRRHVQLLAHVARLAVRGLADLLDDARSAERALGRLEALDVS